MARYLIEVEHDADDPMACLGAIRIFLSTGSHFMTNAEWGCLDGVHKGWIIVEVDSKEEAKAILPAAYRSSASIVKLNRFSLEGMADIMRAHDNV